MLEQAMLRDCVQDMLAQQKQARDGYASLAVSANHEEVRRQASQVQREKLRHIQLSERLLEILD